MSITGIVIIAFITFLAMEWVAWAAHKYIMHGFLWNLHEDHHFDWIPIPKKGYMRSIVKAHQQHHVHPGKEDGECFGMLLVPKRFLRFMKPKQSRVKP